MTTDTTGLAPELALKVEALSTHFVFSSRVVRAVRDVSFSLRRAQTLAIVGESGSGKSVMSLSLMGLLSSPGRIASGRALYRKSDGNVVDLAKLSQKQLQGIRGAEIAMIFQEPMTSLNPLLTIGEQIAEMVLLHEQVSRGEARRRAQDMLELVEIPGAARRLDDYPHQMSGGMRQRVMIALAMVCRPALLIADEPTTALDVTIQAQILDLMRRLQKEMGTSILFITHNMGVVAEIADEVAVMYAGEVIEQAPVRQIFAHPSHPYTRGLLASIPDARRDTGTDGRRRRLFSIPGSVPPPHLMPDGCAFAPRCESAQSECSKPAILADIGVSHLSRCWKSEGLAS